MPAPTGAQRRALTTEVGTGSTVIGDDVAKAGAEVATAITGALHRAAPKVLRRLIVVLRVKASGAWGVGWFIWLVLSVQGRRMLAPEEDVDDVAPGRRPGRVGDQPRRDHPYGGT